MTCFAAQIQLRLYTCFTVHLKLPTHTSTKDIFALQQSSMNHVELSVLLDAFHHVHDLAVDRNVLNTINTKHTVLKTVKYYIKITVLHN